MMAEDNKPVLLTNAEIEHLKSLAAHDVLIPGRLEIEFEVIEDGEPTPPIPMH